MFFINTWNIQFVQFKEEVRLAPLSSNIVNFKLYLPPSPGVSFGKKNSTQIFFVK